MSGVLDFLFDGKTPTSTTTYGNTVTNVPTWLSDYTQGLIAKGNQLAAQPYQLYQGPRVASLTPDQQAAFSKTRESVGKYDPMVQQAGALTQAGAAGVTPDAIKQFENPYMDDVIKKAEMDADRNYNENILPTLSNTFTANGQYGSSRMAEVANQAARNLTDTLQTNSQAARSQGFNTAADIAGKNAASQLQGGQNLGALATTGQNLDLKDAAALESIGATQQGQNQTNLNTAYQDFQNQTGYDKDNLTWLSSIIRGIQTPSSTTSQTTQSGTQNGPSGLSQVTGVLDAISGLASLFGGKAEGGAIKFAEGGLTGIDERTDAKKYINGISPSGALTTAVEAPKQVASMSGPDMTDSWYNNYGGGPEHLFFSSASSGVPVTGFADDTLYTPPPATVPGQKTDYVGLAKDAKNAYDKYQDLFGDNGSLALEPGTESLVGMPYDSAAMNAATSDADLIGNMPDINVATPTLDAGSGLGSAAADLGSGFSSIAGSTLGSAYGLGSAAGVGAANTAADLGLGFSNAGTTLGSQFAGAGSTVGSAAADSAATAGSATGEAAGTAGSSLSATLGAVAPYLMLATTAYDMINGGTNGGKLEHVSPINSYQKEGDINGQYGIYDDQLGLGLLRGTTGSTFGQSFGHSQDNTMSPMMYRDANGNWNAMSTDDMATLYSMGGGNLMAGMNPGKFYVLDGDRFGLDGQQVGFDSMSGQIYTPDGKVYSSFATGDQLKDVYAKLGLPTPLGAQYQAAGFTPTGQETHKPGEDLFTIDWSKDPQMAALVARMKDPNDPFYVPQSTDPIEKLGFTDMDKSNIEGGRQANPTLNLYNKYGKSSGVDYLDWLSRTYDLLNSRTAAS